MESELGRIVDALPGLAWTAFPDGEMDFLSQRWFDVTGLGVDECRDRGWQIAVHPEDLPRLLAGWRTDSALGTPVETEARLRGSNGEYRWFLFRALPSVDASGRVVKWRGLSIDIDKRKQAEEALREEQKRAEALLAGERRLLEMIARGRPVADILEALCRFVESTATGSYCGVMLLDPSGNNLQEAIAPSIASEFNASARGWPLNRVRGPNVMAARDNIQVIMSNVASDTRWRNGWRALAQKHGLRSCCSTPIVSQAGKVLGAFALYWSEPGNPSPLQLELIEQFTHVASIAIELAQRDAALRQSEARLTTAEHELQSMIDTIPAYIAAYEPDGTRSFVNQRWQDYMGLTQEEATGTAAKSFPHFHPDDAEMNDRAWQASLASGEPLSIEVRVRRADGQYRWHTSQRVPLRDENGKIVRWYSVGIDIDDRKSAEEALRRSEARLAEAERELQLTIDSIPTLVTTYRPDGSRIFVNQTWRDYTGLSLEDAEQTSIVHPDDAARIAEEWGTSLASGAPLKTEARLRRADGEYRWHAIHRVLARDEAGAIVKMYNVAVDIEERKRAEEALRASEQNSRLIVDGIPGLVAAFTPNGEFEFINRQIVEYFGRTLDDLKLKRWGVRNGIHPEDRARVTAAFKQSIASGDPFDFELRCKRSDGVYRWFQSRGFPLRDADGRIVRWYNLLIDINERKCAEEALRQSEARLAEAERELRLTLDSIPVITWRGAANGYVQQLNRRWFEYTGTTPEQVRGRRWKSCVHPDDLEPLVDAGTKYVAAGAPVDCEARLRRFDGVYRWFLFRPAPARDESGNIVAWYGTIIDIEDRKSAEEKAFEAERNLKLTVDTIPALAWSARPDGSAEFFNQQYLDYLGFPAEQALGWGWAAAVHPDDLSGLTARWQSLLASGRPGEAEARLRRHDGEYRWFLFRATPLREDNGNIVRWYGFNTDIEDRRRAEEKLRRSEAFLAKAQGLSLTGSFLFNSATTESIWSEELYRIFEFEPGTRVPLKLLATRYHPEDRHVVEEVAGRVRGGAPDFDYEHRLLMPDGSIKHIHVIGHGTPDKDGRTVEYFGAVQDITQRRVAEAALDKARSELAHVTRVMSLGALTASIAHEVNQPLSGIITNASTCLRMLAADPPNIKGAQETARRTIRDGNRAADVIARLRALFSKKAAATETVDLNEATREVLSLVFGDLLRNRVSLRLDLDDDHPLLVIGDRVQLQQVVLNLVRNASDAMRDVNDRPRHLLVKAERDEEGAARLIVTDAGVGLGPQGTERLFEPFYTNKSDGMGIGLSVSRSIIESHGGRLWAEANDGPGATFSFSIPCLPDAARGDQARDAMRNP